MTQWSIGEVSTALGVLERNDFGGADDCQSLSVLRCSASPSKRARSSRSGFVYTALLWAD